MTKLTQHQKVMIVDGLMNRFGFSDWETRIVKSLLFGENLYDTHNSLVMVYLDPILENLDKSSEEEVKRLLSLCVDFCKLLVENWGSLASKSFQG